MKKIVTKDSMIRMLADPRPEYRVRVVGKALVAIFNRQTEAEKNSNDTRDANNIGFSGADGYQGCMSAKYFLKHGTLQDWVMDKWLKPTGKTGYPRIAKYWKQLNEIANEKAA